MIVPAKNHANKILNLILLLLMLVSCTQQSQKKTPNGPLGGPCEDCEALLDYKILGKQLNDIDTFPSFLDMGPKIKVATKIYKPDGKTPASDVIVYVYHTNREGIYQASEDPVGWERRHGQYRGWMKTNANGEFTFYTFRPAPYPSNTEPEHIHIYLKEEGKIPYYIDSYLFDDDPTLTKEELKSQDNRGGSGLINLKEKDGVLTAHRDIILGKNIPNYE